MFRNTKLIFAVVLSGCATAAGDSTPPNFITTEVEETINTTLLETVETTLDIADDAISEILEEKIEDRNKINSLKTLVNKEEELISNLEGSLLIKDSILFVYQENTEFLESKITNVKEELDHAIHKCTTQCYPMITGLQQKNTELLSSVDSLENKIAFLDSLISTNKKLTKLYETNRGNF